MTVSSPTEQLVEDVAAVYFGAIVRQIGLHVIFDVFRRNFRRIMREVCLAISIVDQRDDSSAATHRNRKPMQYLWP